MCRNFFVTISILVSNLLIADSSQWNDWWTYSGISGPSYWGLINPKFMLCNKGKHQSPIDIIPDQLLYDSNLASLHITGNQINGIIENTGRGITVKIAPDENQDAKTFLTAQHIQFNNGPLSYNYTLNHIVMHFGAENGHGSEHRIGGQQFTGEIQLIGYNSQLYNNYTEAETSPNGLFALAFLIQLCSYEHKDENIMLKKLIGNVRSLMDKEDENQMKVSFDLNTLFIDDHYSQYITYHGSLTQPPCSENVEWLIANKPLYISTLQMQLLRNAAIQGSSVDYRPIQAIYKRSVRTNIQFSNIKFLNQIIENYLNPQPDQVFDYLAVDELIDIDAVVNEWSIYVARVYDLEKSELPSIGALKEEKKDVLVAIMSEKNQVIKRFLFLMACKKDYLNLVDEFDWNINLVLASDQINNLNRPLVNLEMTNSKNDKICHLELNEEELDQLIEAVDKIQNELKGLLSV